MKKQKTCEQCRQEASYLLRSATVTGTFIDRCQKCSDRLQESKHTPAMFDVTRFRPKFLGKTPLAQDAVKTI